MMRAIGSKVGILTFLYLLIENGCGRLTFSDARRVIQVTCKNNLIDLLRKHASDNFVVECPPCRLSTCYVYGTTLYSPISWLCCAGVHDGKINNNGSVMEVHVHRTGLNYFEKSRRHGVQSSSMHSHGLSFSLTSIRATPYRSPTTEQEVSTHRNVTPVTTTDLTKAAKSTQTTSTQATSSTKSTQTTSTQATSSTKSTQTKTSTQATESTPTAVPMQTATSTQTTATTSTTRSTLSDRTSAQILKSVPSTTLKLFLTTIKSPQTMRINNTMSTTTATTRTLQAKTHLNNLYVHHIKLNESFKVQTTTFMKSKLCGNNSKSSATTTVGVPSDLVSRIKENNTLQVVYILVGLVLVFGCVIIGLVLARRTNRISWLCRRNRCRRRAQVNDCVCYVAMDSSIQGLLNDPETCQRPCQVRQLLQKEELDLGCSNRTDQDCSNCTEEKCGLSSAYDF